MGRRPRRYRRKLCRDQRRHGEERSSPACLEADHTTCSFPCSRARGPRLPDCFFQVCVSALFLLAGQFGQLAEPIFLVTASKWVATLVMHEMAKWAGPMIKKSQESVLDAECGQLDAGPKNTSGQPRSSAIIVLITSIREQTYRCLDNFWI